MTLATPTHSREHQFVDDRSRPNDAENTDNAAELRDRLKGSDQDVMDKNRTHL